MCELAFRKHRVCASPKPTTLMFSIAAPLAMRATSSCLLSVSRFRWCRVMLACGNATNTSRGAARCSILRASTRGTSMQTGTEQTHIENTRTNKHTIGNHTRNTQHTHHTRTNSHTPNKREQTSMKTRDRSNAGHSNQRACPVACIFIYMIWELGFRLSVICEI